MNSSAVEAIHLSKSFYPMRQGWKRLEVPALQNINFSVRTGESFGIIGPNGSGKSTLLRIISSALLPTRGRVHLMGKSMESLSSLRGLIGMVPGDARGFHGALTGKQNLEFYAALNGLGRLDTRRRLAELAAEIQIEDCLDRPFWTISTGQRQRLSIARALLSNPPILLFDEPLKGIDPWMAQTIRTWIRQEFLHRQKKTLLIATHQTEDISSLCDHVLFLQKGAVRWKGGAQEWLKNSCIFFE